MGKVQRGLHRKVTLGREVPSRTLRSGEGWVSEKWERADSQGRLDEGNGH